jgi:uncharacterized protein (DUF58 family)
VNRLYWLGGLTYVLLLVGLGTMSAPVLVLTLPLAVRLVTGLLRAPSRVDVEVTRSLSSDRVSGGRPVEVRLSVINKGEGLEIVHIQDHVPDVLEVIEGHLSAVTSLAPGEVIDLSYTVRGDRGTADFGPVEVSASDALGVLSRSRTLDTPQRLMILPDVMKLRRVAVRPRRTRAYAGPVPARQGGSGVEFFGVREYQVGDPLRWINWQVSARHPRSLYTNEFEQERITDVGLILDARRRTDVEGAGKRLFEHSVEATASLAAAFLSDGNRVGLLVYGGFLDWTFPGYGRIQEERILRALSGAETGESRVFESLDYIPTRYFPAKSQLVLVSPLCEDDIRTLVRLRARGYQLLIISPDPVAYEARLLGSSPAVRMAVRVARLERALLMRRLQRAGVRTVDWDVETPFDLAIHSSLSRQPHWFRAVGVE